MSFSSSNNETIVWFASKIIHNLSSKEQSRSKFLRNSISSGQDQFTAVGQGRVITRSEVRQFGQGWGRIWKPEDNRRLSELANNGIHSGSECLGAREPWIFWQTEDGWGSCLLCKTECIDSDPANWSKCPAAEVCNKKFRAFQACFCQNAWNTAILLSNSSMFTPNFLCTSLLIFPLFFSFYHLSFSFTFFLYVFTLSSLSFSSSLCVGFISIFLYPPTLLFPFICFSFLFLPFKHYIHFPFIFSSSSFDPHASISLRLPFSPGCFQWTSCRSCFSNFHVFHTCFSYAYWLWTTMKIFDSFCPSKKRWHNLRNICWCFIEY